VIQVCRDQTRYSQLDWLSLTIVSSAASQHWAK